MHTLESVWELREEQVLPALFGEPGPGTYPLTEQTFASLAGRQPIDPTWLHLGVLSFAPTATRSSWIYVTSGGSTPWDVEPSDYDPEGYSWLGVEFVIETQGPADWAIQTLQRLLAYQVLLCHGRFGDAAPLGYGHRVPAGGPINGNPDSPIRFLAIAKPEHYEPLAQLPSGRFDLLHVVGITEDERDFAKATSTANLIEALKAQGAYPVTNPDRGEIDLGAR